MAGAPAHRSSSNATLRLLERCSPSLMSHSRSRSTAFATDCGRLSDDRPPRVRPPSRQHLPPFTSPVRMTPLASDALLTAPPLSNCLTTPTSPNAVASMVCQLRRENAGL
ncbi:hypothetical protein RhiJN_09800 [Ceratobasidium sp. AG-Ba]|nr:hypothetical protein RhiJN_09800 [Ceratobasidium sp. AG-Ba]